jgi:DNA polymerase zeta
VLAESRGDLLPDPQFDGVNIVALGFQNDCDATIEVSVLLHSKFVPCQRYGNVSLFHRLLIFFLNWFSSVENFIHR